MNELSTMVPSSPPGAPPRRAAFLAEPSLAPVLRAPGTLRAWSSLFAGLALFIGALSVFLFAVSGDKETAAAYAARILKVMGRQDSWNPMIMAVEQLRAHPDAGVYAQLLFGGQTKFQYPISSLLLPDLLQRLTGLSWTGVTAALNWASWLCVWALVVVCLKIFVESWRRVAPAGASAIESESAGPAVFGLPLFLLLPGVALTLLFYPLGRSFALGQIQTAMTLLAAGALLAWLLERKALAGLCLGALCAIKPQWAVLFVWGALRREWAMVGAGVGVAAALFLAAGARYGFFHYVDYLAVLSYLSQHGEGFFPNQSVNGLMNRLLHNGNNLLWVGDAFPPYQPLVYWPTVIAGAGLIGAALLYRRRAKAGGLDLALVLLSVTMASPIAWEHHYAVLLPIFALAAPVALAGRPLGRFTGLVLLLAFLVASQRFDVVNRLADGPFNIAQSYLFFAAALVLLLLYRTAATAAAAAAAPGQAEAGAVPVPGDSRDLPLCVDLDGTLIKSDVLIESLLAAASSWRRLQGLPRLLVAGKAGLKAGLAQSCPVEAALLPYEAGLVAFLKDEKARGRRLLLVTASHEDVAGAVNIHLGSLFAEVIASNGERNLRGAAKAEALVRRFGERGFVYAGNDRTDLAVWAHAAAAIPVGAPAGVHRRAERLAPVERAFPRPASVLKAALKEIRPQQWLKNLLVFVPIFTAGVFDDTQDWIAALITFAAFCAVASSLYVLNDLLDLESDRRHPRKCKRPLASGALPLGLAIALPPLLLAGGLALAAVAGVLTYLLAYALLSAAYSFKLKEMPLVDVFLLAALYSARLFTGGVATGHDVSLWLLAFSCFMFLGLAVMKRVTELRDLEARGVERPSRRGYKVGDAAMMTALGTNASFVSSLILALYVQSDMVAAANRDPHVLWLIVPLMLFWQCRLWLATARGFMLDDPIVYTAKDWVSAAVAVSLGLVLVVSHLKV